MNVHTCIHKDKSRSSAIERKTVDCVCNVLLFFIAYLFIYYRGRFAVPLSTVSLYPRPYVSPRIIEAKLSATGSIRAHRRIAVAALKSWLPCREDFTIGKNGSITPVRTTISFMSNTMSANCIKQS